MVKHTMPPAPEWRVTAVLASSVGHGWHIRAPFMQDWSCYCCLYTWIHLWGSPLRTANALQCLICVSFAISNFSSSSGFVWCKTVFFLQFLQFTINFFDHKLFHRLRKLWSVQDCFACWFSPKYCLFLWKMQAGWGYHAREKRTPPSQCSSVSSIS